MRDWELFGLNEVIVLEEQKTMTYRNYLKLKVERLNIKVNALIETKWKGRTDKDVEIIGRYTKAISTTEKLLRS